MEHALYYPDYLLDLAAAIECDRFKVAEQRRPAASALPGPAAASGVGEEAFFVGDGGGLGPGVDAEFGQDPRHVDAGGLG
jgi:hypothetical protein